MRPSRSVAASRPDVTLELVGENRTWPRQDLDAAIAAQRRRRTAFVSGRAIPDGELAGLYAQASVFVFLSEYEGFGLTPLEALANGMPAVVLDTPVAREVCGDAALLRRPGRHRRARPRAIADGCSTTRTTRARVLAAAATLPAPLLVARGRGRHADGPRTGCPVDAP